MGTKPDEGGTNQILDRMEKLACSYTPQWRLDRENPDMGTALAFLFGRIMEETTEDLNHLQDFYFRGFMDEIGCEVKTASPAEGYMTLRLVKPDMPETVIPAGWRLAARGEKGSVSMQTAGEVYVSAASVKISRSSEGEYWLLTFDRPLTQGVISVLFLKMQPEGKEEAVYCWEYYGAGGWTALPVLDGTGGFAHGGIVRFAATSDFTKLEIGENTGWSIRIRPEKGRLLPERLPSVYMNGVKVIADDLGEKGNIKPGQGHRLKKTVGFVSVIENPDYFCGGSEEETFEMAALRTGARLRHQFRAVTPGDYERLVRENCRDVERVRCFAGYEEQGARQWGTVTVAVLLKNYLEGQPYFYRVREGLYEFFRDKVNSGMNEGQRLFITAPRFIRMDVKATLCVRDYTLVMPVQDRAGAALEKFLHPVTGGYEGSGWDMGILPEHGQIKNCLQHVPGVFYVKQLTCLCFEERNGFWEETVWEWASDFPWCLPVPGSFRVEVEVMGQ